MRVETQVVERASSNHHTSQDAHFVGVSPFGTVVVVVDGHSASRDYNRVVRYARELADELGHSFCSLTNEPSSDMIQTICQRTQSRLSDLVRDTTVGAVATIALITNDGITTVQVGDCVIMRYLSSGPMASARITRPHNPDNPLEMDRLKPIYRAGAFRPLCDDESVGRDGVVPTRIFHVASKVSVQFSRSFGDFDFYPAVICDPEVTTLPYPESGEIIYAVCSDGGVSTAIQTFRVYRESNTLTIASQMVPTRPDDDVTVVFARVLRS